MNAAQREYAINKQGPISPCRANRIKSYEKDGFKDGVTVFVS